MTHPGQWRARQLVPVLGTCERCDAPATDRHHIDGDPFNNRLDNIAQLCRRCHMEVDGRLAAFAETARHPKVKPAKPCRTCGRHAKPLRRGECPACAQRTWSAAHPEYSRDRKRAQRAAARDEAAS